MESDPVGYMENEGDYDNSKDEGAEEEDYNENENDNNPVDEDQPENIQDSQDNQENKEIEEREKYVFLAKLNEKAGHYSQMLDYIDQFIALNPILTPEERKFLNSAYKTSITPKRNSWFTVNNLEKKEDSSQGKAYHKEVKRGIELEIKEHCNKITSLIDNFLLPNSPNNESKVYYLTLKGDYLRYQCEINTSDELPKLIESANKCYEKALEFCKSISILNSTKLALALNFAVFLYEIKKAKKEAISFARSIYEEAVNKIESKKETCDIERTIPKDSLFIIQLIKENFIFWNGETSDDDEA